MRSPTREEITEAAAVLHLNLPCTWDEVRRQRNALIFRSHPDRNGATPDQLVLSEAVTKRINNAYDLFKKHPNCLIHPVSPQPRTPEAQPQRDPSSRSSRAARSAGRHSSRPSAAPTDWVSVTSSNLKAACYCADSAELFIQFRDGTVYVYFGVPAEVYHGLLSSASKGRFAHRHIYSRYKYARIR